MHHFSTHYDNLQIARNASDAVIRAAYRGLAQQHHPDKNPDDSDNAEDAMKVLNAAYDVLSDPLKRRDYDEWIMRSEATARPYSKSDQVLPDKPIPFDCLVYPNKQKLFHLAMISMFFVASAFLLLTAKMSEASWWDEPIKNSLVLCAVVFFGFAALSYLTRLINPAPSMIVNEFGVQVATFHGATLRWAEISTVKIEQRNENRFLAIFPTHPQILMRRQSFWGRICTRLQAACARKPAAIFITESLVDVPLEELIGEMTFRIPKPE